MFRAISQHLQHTVDTEVENNKMQLRKCHATHPSSTYNTELITYSSHQNSNLKLPHCKGVKHLQHKVQNKCKATKCRSGSASPQGHQASGCRLQATPCAERLAASTAALAMLSAFHTRSRTAAQICKAKHSPSAGPQQPVLLPTAKLEDKCFLVNLALLAMICPEKDLAHQLP